MSKIRVIPQKKLSNIISREKAACEKCKDLSASCETCLIKEQILTRYFNANIPVRYWKLKMSEFTGDDVLKSVYEKMTKAIQEFILI